MVEDLVDVPVDEFEAELVEMASQKLKELHHLLGCYAYNKPYFVLNNAPNYQFADVIYK